MKESQRSSLLLLDSTRTSQQKRGSEFRDNRSFVGIGRPQNRRNDLLKSRRKKNIAVLVLTYPTAWSC